MYLHRHFLFNGTQQFKINDNNIMKGLFKIEQKRDEVILFKHEKAYILIFLFLLPVGPVHSTSFDSRG